MSEEVRPSRPGLRVSADLVALAGAVSVETVFYPDIAKFLGRFLGGQGDVGSEMLGYVLFDVLPGALVFVLAAGALYVQTARNGMPSRTVLAASWITNGALLIGSIVFYFWSQNILDGR